MAPLTLRYNNPGAVEFQPWMSRYGATLGENGRYAQFPSVDQGYDAMGHVLNTYRTKHGLNTVSDVVNRWAPANVDNNSTPQYAQFVSSRLGVGPNDPLGDDHWKRLPEAMAHYEAGQPVPRGSQSPSPAMPMPFSPQPQQVAPMQPQQEGFSLENWMTSPLFQMGASVLGAPNIGQGLTQGAQNANQIAVNRLRMQTLQEERAKRLKMQEAWGRIFPNGQPDTNHPLLAGVPSEIASIAATHGPEEGLKALQEFQMKRASSRIALEAEAEKRNAMIKQIDALFGGQGAGGASPAMASPTAPVGTNSSPLVPIRSIPGVAIDNSGAATQQAAAAAPQSFSPPAASGDARAAVLNDPALRRIMALNLAVGDTKGAMSAFEKAMERAAAPEIAGQSEYAKERAKVAAGDAKTAEAARGMWGLIDKLERSAKAIGDSRLDKAASPTLDYDGWGSAAYRTMNEQAYNDRRNLQTYIDSIIVQARETQRGLGQLTEGEQATLERAYATMKSSTSAPEFYRALDTVRHVLSAKIPDKQDYTPRWLLEAEAAQRKQAVPPAQATPTRTVDMVPPAGGTQVDTLDRSLDGKTVYNHETGKYGVVINGQFVPKSKLSKTGGQALLLRAQGGG